VRLFPYDCSGYTEREIAVYLELLTVRWGATISYAGLALRAGMPGASRCVGNAMAKNRFPIIIPCHRVIKSDGSIGFYSGGIQIKETLLSLEQQ
jgi:methylated-DNA-[protein]-cysteine S-methyltransferase